MKELLRKRLLFMILPLIVLVRCANGVTVLDGRDYYSGGGTGLGRIVGGIAATGGGAGRYDYSDEEEDLDDEKQDLTKIPGVPAVDYPIFHKVPPTRFNCKAVPIRPGMYANVETGCQAYHVCDDDRYGAQGASFLCANGTIFNQHDFNCDWWYNVDCKQAPTFYNLNLDPKKNPYLDSPEEAEEKYNNLVKYGYAH